MPPKTGVKHGAHGHAHMFCRPQEPPQDQPAATSSAAGSEPPAAAVEAGPSSGPSAPTSSTPAAPSGLGLGASRLPAKGAQKKGPLAFDPLKKSAKSAHEDSQEKKNLPPQVQKLADDIVKLMEEAGIGEWLCAGTAA